MKRLSVAAVIFLASSAGAARAADEPARFRVEQIFRIEVTSAEPQPLPGRLRTEPVRTVVEGRVRFILEQGAPDDAGKPRWRFADVQAEGPRTDPPERAHPGVERVFELGLAWLRRLDGQEFTGPVLELPVLPLGEGEPAWLTRWLHWAQTGGFAGVDADPLVLPPESTGSDAPPSYQLRWLRSEFRQAPCHVQQARWAVSVALPPDSLPPSLAAEGVESRSQFAAQSLEWVAQESPRLIYAERSAARETYWSLEKVQKPELKDLVFRLRTAVEVRVERLP